MLALSIQQPYAHLIIHGFFADGRQQFKDIENRTWYASHRRPFQVHASKKIHQPGIAWVRERFPGITLPTEWRTGGIIGVVDAIDCLKSHNSPWFSGPYGIVLANPYPVPFVACLGALSFFDPSKISTRSVGAACRSSVSPPLLAGGTGELFTK